MSTRINAAVASEHGEPADVLRIESVAAPQPAAGEVTVCVAYASVNPVDWKFLTGAMRGMIDVGFPFRPGCDGAGTVESVGAGVAGLKYGDRVAFNSPLPRCSAFAELVAVPASMCARIPDELEYSHAAALPVVAETARQAIDAAGGVSAGETVLIHGASGAVGCCALQLAKRAGAAVLATASGTNADFVRLLGADTFIDYRTQRFEDRVAQISPGGVDLVIDTAGGETTDRSFAVLKRGGRLISVAGQPDESRAADADVHAEMVFLKPDGKRLASLLELAGKGRLSVEVAETFPLARVAEALEKQRAGGFRGKLLIDCRDA